MAINDEVIDKDTLNKVKDSFDNVKTKIGMQPTLKLHKMFEKLCPLLYLT